MDVLRIILRTTPDPSLAFQTLSLSIPPIFFVLQVLGDDTIMHLYAVQGLRDPSHFRLLPIFRQIGDCQFDVWKDEVLVLTFY